jgi:hypothetical protein
MIPGNPAENNGFCLVVTWLNMHQDILHKGKVYRIISEDLTILHPDEVIVAIFDVSLPGNAKEVRRLIGRSEKEVYRLTNEARKYVDSLL